MKFSIAIFTLVVCHGSGTYIVRRLEALLVYSYYCIENISVISESLNTVKVYVHIDMYGTCAHISIHTWMYVNCKLIIPLFRPAVPKGALEEHITHEHVNALNLY